MKLLVHCPQTPNEVFTAYAHSKVSALSVHVLIHYLQCQTSWSEVRASKLLKEVFHYLTGFLSCGLRANQETVQLVHQLRVSLMNLHVSSQAGMYRHAGDNHHTLSLTDLFMSSLPSLIVSSVAGGVSLHLGCGGSSLVLVAGHEELTETWDGQHFE